MKLGFIGCGVISMAHLEGLEQLKNEGKNNFALSAVCDLLPERAEAFTAEVEERLGSGPKYIQIIAACWSKVN